MLDRLLEAAAASHVREIVGVYRPTPKNSLVANLYDNLGFSRMPGEARDEIRYSLLVPERVPITAIHIRDLTPRGALAGTE